MLWCSTTLCAISRNTLRLNDPVFSIWNEFAKLRGKDNLPSDAPADPAIRQVAASNGSPRPVVDASRDHDNPQLDTVERLTNRLRQEIARGDFQVAPATQSILAGLPPRDLLELAGRYQTLFAIAEAEFDPADFQESEDEMPDTAETDPDQALRSVAQLVFGAASPFRMPVDMQKVRSKAVRDQLAELRGVVQKIRAAAPPPLPIAMVAKDAKTVANTPIHIRGSHLTKAKEGVPRGFLEAFNNIVEQPQVPPDQSGRLQYAQWLTNPNHPLTARVMVNRIWMHHFGQGIVRSPSNFGLRGEPPTHPELLDYLALRFIEDGWSVKAMHRRIMLSATYQMSTEFNEQCGEVDPENRYLWRMNRLRLEAEPIRDSMLALAGRLDATMYGCHPDFDGDEYDIREESARTPPFYMSNRRSIYIPVVRSLEYDFFKAFDYSDASVDLPQRSATVIAPQALFVMNSPFVIKLAEDFAKTLLARQVSDEERIKLAFEMAYGRLPDQSEISDSLTFIARVNKNASDGTDRLKAWKDLCHVIMASSEFLYLN